MARHTAQVCRGTPQPSAFQTASPRRPIEKYSFLPPLVLLLALDR